MPLALSTSIDYLPSGLANLTTLAKTNEHANDQGLRQRGKNLKSFRGFPVKRISFCGYGELRCLTGQGNFFGYYALFVVNALRRLAATENGKQASKKQGQSLFQFFRFFPLTVGRF